MNLATYLAMQKTICVTITEKRSINMSIRTYAALTGLVGALILPHSVSAAPVYDNFGALDAATFGGTGIPNGEVAVSSQFSNGSSLITVAMSATQRYSNPALTNDGAGTYFAQAGSNFGGAGQSGDEGALWNFNYYINIDSVTETLADYQIDLFYDFDPAFDNGMAGIGLINVTNAILGTDPTATLSEGSENLMFSFLAADYPGIITAPGGTFDPNIAGEYNFGIRVSQAGWGIENVAMDVDVSAVPLPAAAWLFGSAILGLGFVKRRKA
jgi:hypothetical protein